MALRIVELRDKRDALVSELEKLGAKKSLSPGEEEHFDRCVRQRDRLVADIETLEERADRTADIRRRYDAGELQLRDGMPTAPEMADRTLNGIQGAALRALERLDIPASAADTQERLIRHDSKHAQYIEIHSRSEYSDAFGKLVTLGPDMAQYALSDLERAALHDSLQLRTQDTATTHGGFALPIFIDPSVILTDQENENAMLRICNVVNISTNQWKGVSAAGVAWSFDAEFAEVSDDSITLAQPTVDVHTARGFIPFSIEVGEDWPGFQSEMARLLAAGYDELLLNKLTTGTGTGEPHGILDALVEQTTTETTVGTDGAFTDSDVYKVWKALPSKYRRRASWMMSVGVMSKIRQFGASTSYHAQTTTLPDGAIDRIFERPVYENPYFADFTGTTGAANLLVVGDFSSYTIVQRTGMSVELVPHLFAVGGGGRPTGSRGFFAYARVGGDVNNLSGFQILCNT